MAGNQRYNWGSSNYNQGNYGASRGEITATAAAVPNTHLSYLSMITGWWSSRREREMPHRSHGLHRKFQVPAGPAVTPGILKGGPTTPVPLAITISDIETLERNALNRPATTPTSLAITISDVETPEKKSLNRTKEPVL
ncbi:hypothetical protein PFLUV_G00241080 [Perca fluviatilis]|uniref:Uncharacterized protein n=1 Tax=Perca fluviatilis TaxID=8168 RepID=A0A6A5EC74_PERFL|nr:hypothetical protein PFLUV_G00241080 [Perca fluviatilis]